MTIRLKYGTNPHQGDAELIQPDSAPLAIRSGQPSYINVLDALGAWQLARELKAATGKPGAASFKHTSPAGAAVARPIDDVFRRSQFLPAEDLSPVAEAYVRARGGDRMSSFGDVVAVSEVVDLSLAWVLKREVVDLIIAPGYDPDALDLLKTKKRGAFLILEIDPAYAAPENETREVFGFKLRQARNHMPITADLFQTAVTAKRDVPADVVETLVVATIALKYTQSNSVCVARDGQVIGMGAGQQSRIHCTRLACDKADKWLLAQHPKTLALDFVPKLGKPDKANVVDQYLLWEQLSDGERRDMLAQLGSAPEPITAAEKADWIGAHDNNCLSSDAFIPFRDNIDRAARSNVRVVAQSGNSVRDDLVTAAADEHGMVMFHTGYRWFLH